MSARLGQMIPHSVSTVVVLCVIINIMITIVITPGVYHGTYSLTNDHSPFCPEDDGYSGHASDIIGTNYQFIIIKHLLDFYA